MTTNPISVDLAVACDGVEHRVELGYVHIRSLLGDLPESEALQPLLRLLSNHPASAIRRAVAEHFALPADIVDRLSVDPCLQVVNDLVVGHADNRALLDTATVLRGLEADVYSAGRIVASLDEYHRADRQALEAAVVGHSDPEVRMEAARYLTHRRSIKTTLLNDPDPAVRAEAAS